ncbi:sel1 repeat family protein [Halomonas sp. BLK-85]
MMTTQADKIMHLFHKNLNAIILTALVAVAPQASAMASEDQTRIAQDIIRTLDAYAVYKMGQYDRAFEQYLDLAEDGNVQGMLNVANMYSTGKGIEQSDGKALNWYQKAAEAGNRLAMQQVANAYRQGNGVKKDMKRAEDWERRAQAVD